jgi:hypothetical protein
MEGLPMKFQVVLGSNQRGDITSTPAASRLQAFEIARAVLDDCIARERASSWFIGEIISVRVEAGDG